MRPMRELQKKREKKMVERRRLNRYRKSVGLATYSQSRDDHAAAWAKRQKEKRAGRDLIGG